jgi:hypothetical protein
MDACGQLEIGLRGDDGGRMRNSGDQTVTFVSDRVI